MNVWIVSDGEPLPTDKGKVRLRRMGILSEVLLREGHEVHWFSSAFHHYKKEQRSDSDKEVIIKENYTIHLLKTNGYKKNVSLSRILHYRKLSESFLEKTKKNIKPDIIITTLAPLNVSKTVVDYANQNNIPIVVDVRDLWPEIFNEVVPVWGKYLIKPYIMFSKIKLKKLVKNSTSLISVTPQFLTYGLDTAKIEKRKFDKVFHTSYKPRDISMYSNLFEDNWAKFGIDKSDFIVIFLGNFGQQFVLDPIIKAADNLKQYNNIKFVLCGTGDSLEKIRADSSNLKNVILPGWIEEEQILSLLSVASVGIAPYKNSINFTKNTPNKFGEYLSASLPIALGVNGVMKDLISDYTCGFHYKNSEELATELETLYWDKEKHNTMSDNAYKLFDDKFNADKVYSELEKHLKEITTEYSR